MHRLSALLLSLPLLVACGGRPSMGWTSYSFERRSHSPSAWTADGDLIWVNAGRVYRVEGDSVEEDKQAQEVNFGHTNRYIYGTAPDDIWIDCALHFDGVSWRHHMEPIGGANGPRGTCGTALTGTALYGAARDRYFELYTLTQYLEWDGTLWAPRSLPRLAHDAAGAEAVHGTGPNDVHVVGARSYLAHFDGKEWRLQEAPLPAWLAAVWVKSPVEAYAAGSIPPADDYLWPAEGGVLLAWDGNRWQQIASPTPKAIRHLAGDRDNLYLATDREVFERDGQGRWSKVFEVEEGRTIKHRYAAGGLLMFCDYSEAYRPTSDYREGIRLWVRR